MSSGTGSSIRLFGAYCGLFYILTVLVGWALIAGFLPPIHPSAGAESVAALFRSDYTRIRIGMIVVMWSALAFIPFAAVVSHFLARIEGSPGVLAYTALLGGVGNMVLTFYPAVWWLVAAYRPDRPPEIIYVFNDMAWLQFIGGVSMFDALPLAVAVGAMCDKSATPVFPRWLGFVCLLTVILIMPDQLLFFFHSGPFSWNGLFGLWIPVGAFSLWFVVLFVVLRNIILRERAMG